MYHRPSCVDRIGQWLVGHIPSMRATRDGMRDGRAGLLPVNRHGDNYCHYLNGWLIGDARVPDHERPAHLGRAYVRGMQSSYMP